MPLDRPSEIDTAAPSLAISKEPSPFEIELAPVLLVAPTISPHISDIIEPSPSPSQSKKPHSQSVHPSSRPSKNEFNMSEMPTLVSQSPSAKASNVAAPSMSDMPTLVSHSPSAKPSNVVAPSMSDMPTLVSHSPSAKPSNAVSPSMLPASPTVPSVEPSVEMQPFSTSMPISRGNTTSPPSDHLSPSAFPSSSSNYHGEPLSPQPISNTPSQASHSSYNDQQIAWLRIRVGPPPVGIYCDIDSECGLDGICKFSLTDI